MDEFRLRLDSPATHESFSEGAARLRDVEIFRVGPHRGKDYTSADLYDIVKNFQKFSSPDAPKILLHVPGVIGHEEDQQYLQRTDLPAAGWVTHLHTDGTTLFADFDGVPAEVTRLLLGKAYRTVSAEIYDEPPEGVPAQGKMLRRVAFLGAEIPEVKGLSEIPTPEVYSERRPFASRAAARLIYRGRVKLPGGAYAAFSEVARMAEPRRKVEPSEPATRTARPRRPRVGAMVNANNPPRRGPVARNLSGGGDNDEAVFLDGSTEPHRHLKDDSGERYGPEEHAEGATTAEQNSPRVRRQEDLAARKAGKLGRRPPGEGLADVSHDDPEAALREIARRRREMDYAEGGPADADKIPKTRRDVLDVRGRRAASAAHAGQATYDDSDLAHPESAEEWAYAGRRSREHHAAGTGGLPRGSKNAERPPSGGLNKDDAEYAHRLAGDTASRVPRGNPYRHTNDPGLDDDGAQDLTRYYRDSYDRHADERDAADHAEPDEPYGQEWPAYRRQEATRYQRRVRRGDVVQTPSGDVGEVGATAGLGNLNARVHKDNGQQDWYGSGALYDPKTGAPYRHSEDEAMPMREKHCAMLAERGMDPGMLDEMPDHHVAAVAGLLGDKGRTDDGGDDDVDDDDEKKRRRMEDGDADDDDGDGGGGDEWPLPAEDDQDGRQKFRERARKFRERLRRFREANAAYVAKYGEYGEDNPGDLPMGGLDKMSERKTSLQREIEQLQKFREETLAMQKRQGIDAVVERLSSQGKLPPAMRERVRQRLLRADSVTPVKFSEGGKTRTTTELDLQIEELERAPRMFGELMSQPQGDAGHDAEVAKVQKFSETAKMAPALRALKKTPAEWAKQFEELRKQKPTLTAADYGVPEDFTS